MSPRKLKLSKRLRIPNYKYEYALKDKGHKFIAGLDEVGRGSWAGPVVAAAVILPQKRIYKIRDSKLLSHPERQKLARIIIKRSISYSIYFISHYQIDDLGLHKANILAYKKALKNLKTKANFILVDAYKIPRLNTPHQPIIKGDMKCISIAAASIIAKVARDNYMVELSRVCREYQFERNKGYPSKYHIRILNKLGPSRFHRKSFTPIANLVDRK